MKDLEMPRVFEIWAEKFCMEKLIEENENSDVPEIIKDMWREILKKGGVKIKVKLTKCGHEEEI